MKFLKILAVITLIINECILLANSKCVMYDACSTKYDYDANSGADPLKIKWNNCKVDMMDPVRLSHHSDTARLYKELCPMLYHEDKPNHVCCSHNQLLILQNDIQAASAVLDSCPSCYMNFRTFWCYMTCHENQSDFIRISKDVMQPYVNLTRVFEARKHKQDAHDSDNTNNENTDDDYGDEDENDYENEEVVDKKQLDDNAPKSDDINSLESNSDKSGKEHNNDAVVDYHASDDEYAVDGHEAHRSKRNSHYPNQLANLVEGKSVLSVSELTYFVSEEFFLGLIDSCKSVKLYGSDALQSICGVPSKECTPTQFARYIGLEVSQRPFDMRIEVIQNKTEHWYKKTDKMIPANPEAYKCNQKYQLGHAMVAKCSCSSCSESCDLDLSMFNSFDKRKEHFKIGAHDGLFIVMLIIFLVFSTAFLVLVGYFWKRESAAKRDRRESTRCDDRPMNTIFCLDKLDLVGEKFEFMISDKFSRLGKFCATYPKLVLFLGFSFCGLMCLGFVNFKVEKDPINLWSAESSIARQNKKYFDENFDPFYRITQVIILPKEIDQNPKGFLSKSGQQAPNANDNTKARTKEGLVLEFDILKETYDLYNKLNNITAHCDKCRNGKGKRVTLKDICFQPLSPTNKNCAIQAIFQYWSDSSKLTNLLTDAKHNQTIKEKITSCMKNPFEDNCLSSFGGPIQPFMVVGGYRDNEYNTSNALIMTYIINNYKNDEHTMQAMSWESEALKILKNYTSPLINVYYTTERSIEDEIDRQSQADIKIIVVSYLAMFLYLTLTLGKYSSIKLKIMLLETKILLGLAGVILVLLSVFSSGGLFTYIGVPATLITLEVIPFLLLAVGVDNIYVIVQTYQNDERGPMETVEDQIARVVGKVGPSMLLSGVTQSVAFLLSAMTPMPGVRAFSLYASLAIILNFIMQITCFVVLLSLDAKREKSKRPDILCCCTLNLSDDDTELYSEKKSLLYRFFRKYYTPILLSKAIRPIILVLFFGFFCFSISNCAKLKIGLNQRLAMPVDSYQIKYFDALQKYLAVGPPVYFVLKDGFNYSNVDDLRKLCGSPSCEADSLQSLIAQAARIPNVTFIAEPPVNWIDDYMQWLEPNYNQYCCYSYVNESKRFCDAFYNEKYESECEICKIDKNQYNMPTAETMLKYSNFFLNQNPGEHCIKAGHAMYGSAVKLVNKDDFDDDVLPKGYFKDVQRIGSSHFMAYHSVLSTSEDFINAMTAAHTLANTITDMLNKNNTGKPYEVFPYSIFYVFYEQYLTIWKDATMQLIFTLFAVFVCTFIFLSFDLFTALIVTGVISVIIIDMVGVMYLWDIELNAVSLVNLVIAIGISVEFTAHIARAFATSPQNTRIERAEDAMRQMGPPVFSGILQSIVGISVLAFANSQLFQVFYFRMYFTILVLGLTHGLIFLPVLLSFIGRRTNHSDYLKIRITSNNNNSPSNQSNSQDIQFQEQPETLAGDEPERYAIFDEFNKAHKMGEPKRNTTTTTQLANYEKHEDDADRKLNADVAHMDLNNNPLNKSIKSQQYSMLNKIVDDASQEETSLDNDENPEERPLTRHHKHNHHHDVHHNSLDHSFRGNALNTSFKRLLSTTSSHVKSALFASGSHENENGFDDESNSYEINDDEEDVNGFNDEILSQSLTGSYQNRHHNHHHHHMFNRSHSRERKPLDVFTKPLRNCVSPMSSAHKLKCFNASSNGMLNSNEHDIDAVLTGTPALPTTSKRMRTISNSSTKSFTNNIELYNLNSLNA